jgi:hypothetical protein
MRIFLGEFREFQGIPGIPGTVYLIPAFARTTEEKKLPNTPTSYDAKLRPSSRSGRSLARTVIDVGRLNTEDYKNAAMDISFGGYCQRSNCNFGTEGV